MVEVAYVVALGTGGRRLLQLDRDVPDAVFLVHDLLHLVEKQTGISLIRRIQEHVCRKGLASRRDGPDVNIMD